MVAREAAHPRWLGAAFLLQACTSLISGLIVQVALIAPGNVGQTLANIANRSALMRLTILGDGITAIGIVFLGAMLFMTLKREGETIALVAFGLYMLEAGLLALSKLEGFTVLRISQDYVAQAHPANLMSAGGVALDSMNFAATLALFPFGVGAVIFYYLLYRSKIVPAALALWGLATVPLVLAGTLVTIAGSAAPIVIYLPYVPFEFVIGIWFLVRGLRPPVRQPRTQAAL